MFRVPACFSYDSSGYPRDGRVNTGLQNFHEHLARRQAFEQLGLKQSPDRFAAHAVNGLTGKGIDNHMIRILINPCGVITSRDRKGAVFFLEHTAYKLIRIRII